MSINSEITDIKDDIDSIDVSLADTIKNRILQLKTLSTNPEGLSDDELKEEIRAAATLLKQDVTSYRAQIASAKSMFISSKANLSITRDTLSDSIDDASDSVLNYKNTMNNYITSFDNSLNDVRDKITESTQDNFS